MAPPRSKLFLFMPYVPYPVDRGTYQRVFNLFREQSKEFEIDLACLQDPDEEDRDIAPLKQWANRVVGIPYAHPPWRKFFPDRIIDPLPTTVRHWIDDSVLAALRSFVQGREYDVIQFIDLILWPYVRDLYPSHQCRVMDRSRVDWLFQTEELRKLRLSLKERLLRLENLWKVRGLERDSYSCIRSMIVCGEDDSRFLEQKHGSSEKVFVLPNGFNREYFSTEAYPPTRSKAPSILFCGALDYSPNVDGINWFAENAWPALKALIPSLRWTIVGKSPDERSTRWADLDGVDLVGEVKDVRPAYQEAWLQVVPLRIGGGTRLKIVESLAMRTPVVSTSLGAQGLDLAHGRHLLLADSTEAFVESVCQLIQDAVLRSELEEAGLRKVQECYDWAVLGGRLNAHLKSLVPK